MDERMDGWRQGCGDASDVRPFKDESGNQSRPQPDATSPVNLKASIRQPVFERLLHPVVLFPPTFFFFFSIFTVFFPFSFLHAQPKKLSCEQYLLQKLSLVMCFYFSPMSTSVY